MASVPGIPAAALSKNSNFFLTGCKNNWSLILLRANAYHVKCATSIINQNANEKDLYGYSKCAWANLKISEKVTAMLFHPK